MNLERVEHLDANVSRGGEKYMGKLLALGAIFLAYVIKVYASLTALSSIGCHEHAPAHDRLTFSAGLCQLSKDGVNCAPANGVGSGLLISINLLLP